MERDAAAAVVGSGKKRGLEFPDPANFAGHVAAPFSLASIGVTVLDLGAVHRASFAPRYWSSRGCLYHHAYPVGYRASKVHFGRVWIMSIEAGECGPVFRVTDEETGQSHVGPSPTKPWTAVCVSKNLKTRISGGGRGDALVEYRYTLCMNHLECNTSSVTPRV